MFVAMIYDHNNLITEMIIPIVESIFIELPKSMLGLSKNVIIGNIYRPPSSDIDAFNDFVSNLLNKVKSEKNPN